MGCLPEGTLARWRELIPVTSHNCLETCRNHVSSRAPFTDGEKVSNAVVLLPLHHCLQREMGWLTYLLAKGGGILRGDMYT